jgi:urease accessory protein UreE
VGDGVFFDCRNLHRVAEPTGRRLTLSLFVGLTLDGDVLLWS